MAGRQSHCSLLDSTYQIIFLHSIMLCLSALDSDNYGPSHTLPKIPFHFSLIPLLLQETYMVFNFTDCPNTQLLA